MESGNDNAIIASSRLCVKFLVSTRPSLNRTIIAPSLSILPCHSPFPCAIALNSVRWRDMPARETCQLRERLQAAPGGNRPRRTNPSEKWRALSFRLRLDVTRTNNAAERATSGSETNRKTVRGDKSEEGTLNGLGLTRRAWRGRDGLQLSGLGAARRNAVRRGSCVLRNPPQRRPTVSGTLAAGLRKLRKSTLGERRGGLRTQSRRLLPSLLS